MLKIGVLYISLLIDLFHTALKGCSNNYTPETKFGGVYRSHPVVGRLVGRSGGRSVGRSVGPAVRCVFLFQYNFIQ